MATTALSPAASRLPAPLLQELRGIMNTVPALLPPDIPFEQFRAGLWLELQQHPRMDECTPASLVAAVVKAANAGLVPGRDCHLLPFRNKGRYEVTHVPNYGGVVLSLERTGKIRKAFAHAVYSHDHFEVDYLEDRFSHKPHQTSQRGELKCFYGCVLLKDGTRHFELMSLAQIDDIRRRAPGHDTGPWATDYEQMARKTALKRVAKYVRLSPQQRQMLDDDDTREATDPTPERFRENVSDLYGDPREVPNFAQKRPVGALTPSVSLQDTPERPEGIVDDLGANEVFQCYPALTEKYRHVPSFVFDSISRQLWGCDWVHLGVDSGRFATIAKDYPLVCYLLEVGAKATSANWPQAFEEARADFPQLYAEMKGEVRTLAQHLPAGETRDKAQALADSPWTRLQDLEEFRAQVTASA